MTELRLSSGTQCRLEVLFPPGPRETAAKILVEECSQNLPSCSKSDMKGLERIHFAALKLSKGDLRLLRKAVDLAKTDWRDLLMAADFGLDVQAHESWMPRAPDRLP